MQPVPLQSGDELRLGDVVMTTDGDGHLWYVRAGYNRIEEVAA